MSVLENNFGQFESSRESATANAWSQSAFAEIMSDRLYSSGARRVDDPNWLGNLVLEDSSQTNTAAAEVPTTETPVAEAPAAEAPVSAEPNAVPASGDTGEGPKVAYAVVRPENGPTVVEGPGPQSSGDARAKGRGTYHKPGEDSGMPKTLPGSPEADATPVPGTRSHFNLEPTESPKARTISERVKNAMDEVKQRHAAGEGAFGKAFHFPTEEEQQARDIEKMKNALAEVAKRRPPHDPSEPPKESPFKKRVPAENPNPGNETPTETPAETPIETPPATPAEIPAETPAETPVETPPAIPPEEPPHVTIPPEQPAGYENEEPVFNG